MPLPVGHSLSAYAIYDAVNREGYVFSWRVLLLFALVTNLPDFDFIPGYFFGDPNLFHRHFMSHSLGAAVVAGLVFGFISSRVKGRSFLFNFCLFGGLYFSHVFLDVFSNDTSQPFGVPLLWPFSHAYFYSPVSIFKAVQKSAGNADFLRSLFVWHNIWAAVWEIIVFVPVIALVRLVKTGTLFQFSHKRRMSLK